MRIEPQMLASKPYVRTRSGAVKQDPRLLTQLEAKYAQDPEFQRWTNGQGTLNEAAAIKMALRHLSN